MWLTIASVLKLIVRFCNNLKVLIRKVNDEFHEKLFLGGSPQFEMEQMYLVKSGVVTVNAYINIYPLA